MRTSVNTQFDAFGPVLLLGPCICPPFSRSIILLAMSLSLICSWRCLVTHHESSTCEVELQHIDAKWHQCIYSGAILSSATPLEHRMIVPVAQSYRSDDHSIVYIRESSYVIDNLTVIGISVLSSLSSDDSLFLQAIEKTATVRRICMHWKSVFRRTTKALESSLK